MKKLFIYVLALASAMTIVSCGEKPTPEPEPSKPEKGVVLHNQLIDTDKLAGEKGKYNIYLPIEAWENTDRKFPVLYLLHGMWSDNEEWYSNGYMQTYTYNAKTAGTVGDFIVVMPLAWDSFYINGFDMSNGKYRDYEDFFWKELKPYIESHYPVATGRENTAIAGLSMGGFGASYYAFKYPEKFCFCYEMSGAVEGMGWDAIPSVKQMFQKYGYDKPGFDFNTLPTYYMDCGDKDANCYKANVNTHEYLESINFPHTYRVGPGGVHDWAYWRACYIRMMHDLPEAFKPAK